MDNPLLVSPQWLQDHLADPAVQVIENPWVYESYHKAHITGALRVPRHPYLKQIDANGERTRHVMDAAAFTNLCHELGLHRDRHYVVYDDFYGLFAARFWWVCRYFGMDNVSVLDGSWRGWLAAGGAISSRLEAPVTGSDIGAEPRCGEVVGWEELGRLHANPDMQVWDTRRPGEYSGSEETDNQRRGHLPGARNLVWTDLLTRPTSKGEARFLKPLPELKQVLSDLGLNREKTVITYCQSGIRAAFCIMVLTLVGFPWVRLYDGSMAEWANLAQTPLVEGP